MTHGQANPLTHVQVQEASGQKHILKFASSGQAALVWGWELFNGNIPRCIKEWVKGIPSWPYEREPTVVSHSTVSPTYRCVSANKLKRNASKRRIYVAHGSAALSCSASNHRS